MHTIPWPSALIIKDVFMSTHLILASCFMRVLIHTGISILEAKLPGELCSVDVEDENNVQILRDLSDDPVTSVVPVNLRQVTAPS